MLRRMVSFMLTEHSNGGNDRMSQGFLYIDMLSRVQGCLLGQPDGDALGSLVEFRDPDSQANGTMMRISPLGIFGANHDLTQWPSGHVGTQRSLILIRSVKRPTRCSRWPLPQRGSRTCAILGPSVFGPWIHWSWRSDFSN